MSKNKLPERGYSSSANRETHGGSRLDATPCSASHDTPVNQQAAKMFWKSPWWAKPPDKPGVKYAQPPNDVDLENLVDYRNPPPKPRRGGTPLKDWRGVRLVAKRGGDLAVIIGYCEHNGKSSKWTRGGTRSNRKATYWWAILEKNGEIVRMCPAKKNWAIFEQNARAVVPGGDVMSEE
jgi:hypothetical protein